MHDSTWTQRQEGRSVFLQDAADTFLMYEFLSGGLVIGENHTVTLKDEELSSMRPAKAFHRIVYTRVPKTPSAIARTLADLPSMGETLEMDTFEQLLLASVYVAHRGQRTGAESRQAWGHLFCQLVAAITHDLTRQVVRC
ncbi:protein FAM180A-like isoform X2 [Pristis pectinata]|uniref:protein FAM180A-like isoform X2 n=1 Tax=Pristis pectinata TaxID=685728 RepID=UPI00223DCAB5|nr:protein FAM180A-like isoform X2 [Pristis pectinata]